ncbi:MAG: glycerophosphodiester phosphodiesterase family protein [Promethearchaeota archaeon]
MFLETLQKKKGKRWLILSSIFLVNLLLIFSIILLIEPYWADMNYYVSDMLGYYINLVQIFIILLILPLIYSCYLFIKLIRIFSKVDELNLSKFNKIIISLILIIYNAVGLIAFIILSSYTKIIFQRLEFYSIPLNLTLCIILFILLYPIFKYSSQLRKFLSEKKLNPSFKLRIISISVLVCYFISFIFPIIFIPANVLYSSLPKKPDIIAHRGGSQMGPENTIEVAETALDHDIVGWEVDIRISKDGVPFLMHDDSLKRTTNIEDVFPERKNDLAESFDWKDLRKLDAGTWYIEWDPYKLISNGILSESQVNSYKGAKIPSFEEVLNFTNKHNLILDFDEKSPPEDHSYHEKFEEILFNMTLDLIDDLDKIMIPTDSEVWLDLIKKNNASDIWTYEDYDNTGDGYTNQEYLKAYQEDFPIMVYTINSKERFSQLWCLGVKWVKTDAPYLFEDLDEPLWYLPFTSYLIIWIFVYISLGICILLFKKILRP